MPPALRAARRKAPLGSPTPRVAPPRPLKTREREFAAQAAEMAIDLYPWQHTAGRYIEATNANGNWLYPEVTLVVGRQNGKTTLLLPHIVRRLRMGRRIMHTAQNRELPRETFNEVAAYLAGGAPEPVDLTHPWRVVGRDRNDNSIQYQCRRCKEKAAEPFATICPVPPEVSARRRLPAEISSIRYANGQEEIRLKNGGVYRIVAATHGGARGPANDDVIIDEIREFEDHDFIAAAKPTTSARPNPQIVYLSNAGTAESAVLNALKARAAEDPSLAYLEWSASEEVDAGDVRGWCAANPAIGHMPGKLENLEREYRANLLGGTMEVFEVEYLCRWQTALESRLLTPQQWTAQEFGDLGRPTRAFMAISMDVNAQRASAVIAWREEDGRIALDVHDTTGDPIDSSLLGPDLEKLAHANRAWAVGFDPYTDADLARYVRKGKAINGREYASASEKFVRLAAEKRLHVHDPKGILADDLRWTIRRHGQFGTYMADRADSTHANTSVLAAVRAAWLASAPTSMSPARIY